MRNVILVIDIGGSSMRVGVVDENTIPKPALASDDIRMSRGIFPFADDEIQGRRVGMLEMSKEDITGDFDADSQVLFDRVAELGERFEITSGCILLPGPFDANGNLLMLPNLSEWPLAEIRQRLRKELEFPIVFANDALGAGLAEFFALSPRPVGGMMYISWGTGLGASVVREFVFGDEQLIYAQGVEPEHQKLFGDERDDLIAGGAGIERFFGKPVQKLTKKDVPKVIETMHHMLRALLVVHPVDVLVFGGGVSLHNPEFVDQIQKKLSTSSPITGLPQVSRASYGDQAGLAGAAMLARAPWSF